VKEEFGELGREIGGLVIWWTEEGRGLVRFETGVVDWYGKILRRCKGGLEVDFAWVIVVVEAGRELGR